MKRYLGILVFAVSAFGQSIPSGARIPAAARIPAGAERGGGGTYAHYIAISTASGQEGSSDSSSFPMCVNTGSSGGCSPLGIASYLAVSGSGGYVQNTVTQTGGNGGTEPADAVFGTSSTCSTLLPWETEVYTTTTGAWIAWVQLPTLHHSTQDTFYLCFDATGVTTQQNTGNSAPSAVWETNFKGVWHLPNGSTLSAKDSTSNANNGTLTGPPTAGTGRIDGGGVFSGSGQYISGAMSSVGFPLTMSCWFNVSTNAYYYTMLSQDQAGTGGGYALIINAGNDLEARYAGSADNAFSSLSVAENTWYYGAFTATSASSSVIGYLGSSSLATQTVSNSGAPLDTPSEFSIGAANGSGSLPFPGSIDECRISSIVRSADWITAEFNNQKASGTFLTAGSLH